MSCRFGILHFQIPPNPYFISLSMIRDEVCDTILDMDIIEYDKGVSREFNSNEKDKMSILRFLIPQLIELS